MFTIANNKAAFHGENAAPKAAGMNIA